MTGIHAIGKPATAPYEPTAACKIAAHNLIIALDRELDGLADMRDQKALLSMMAKPHHLVATLEQEIDDLPEVRDQHALLAIVARHTARRIDALALATRGELASARILLFGSVIESTKPAG